ncbi:MAG: WYL domain-containing protein [Muribaculaceae bacterium]|nr:WYL domain-containing protein [Muribaculaceae bacterium]
MKIPALFKEYIWLIETLNRSGKITFAELSELWKNRKENDGAEFSRTTFNRHRDAILDMFGIIIDCDRRDGNRYFIYNKEVLEEDSVQNWIFSTLSVSNMLNENLALRDRILLESIPSGDEKLQQIIKAMRENRRLMLTYRRYGAAAAYSFAASPYCVKLFRRRWYLLALKDNMRSYYGYGEEESFAIFSLDRIEKMELMDVKFTIEPEFDAAAFFNECFGVVIADGSKPTRIVLRAYGNEPHYMRDLPLHNSQKEILTTAGYTDFELMMRPTPDFLGYVMSKGEWLQIISPAGLAEEVVRWHRDAIERYKKDSPE